MLFSGFYSGLKYVFSPPMEEDSICTHSSSSTFFSSQLTPCEESQRSATIIGIESLPTRSDATRISLSLEEVLERYIDILTDDKCDPSELPDLYTEPDELSDFLNSTTNPLRISRAIRIFEESIRNMVVAKEREPSMRRKKKIRRN
ncbi:hypothetical protein CLIB1423_02S05226 [[Candida] railenensis]|uniref:Uncharacterized protein n=1 Tax=[Candida] railenensis TaxID=45579 RepID=A0A9P0VWT6_9ASCO|nr:hypothetical protein CLIB1423_02S05226 [[Candida] railenensis]